MKKKLFVILLITLPFSLFAQNWLWGRQGTNRNIMASGSIIATDSIGDAFTASVFLDSISFGNVHLNSLWQWTDMYVVKYDSSGNLKWAVQSYSPSSASGVYQCFVTADAKGNSYVTGNFNDTVVFGNDTLISSSTGYGDMFLVKYDVNGNVVWAKQSFSYAEPFSGASGMGASVDKAGNIYVAGDFRDSVMIGKTQIANKKPTALGGGVLVKFNSSGSVLWATSSSDASSACVDDYEAVAADGFSGVYVSVTLVDTVNGAYLESSNSKNGAFRLLRFDTAGGIIFDAYTISSSTSASTCGALSVDAYGNCYAAGEFNDTVIYGGRDTIIGSSGLLQNIFVAKYGRGGNLKWVRAGKGNITYVYVAADTLNDVYLAGCVPAENNLPTFGADSVNNMAHPLWDSFIMKLDSAGHPACVSIARAAGGGYVGVACDASGKFVYMSGLLVDTITFNADFLKGDSNTFQPYVARWQYCSNVLLQSPPVKTKIPFVSLYPNPNNGVFNLSISNYQLGMNSSVEIYNVLGEKVFSSQFSLLNTQISINQPSGIYLYRIISQNGELVSEGKFVIEK